MKVAVVAVNFTPEVTGIARYTRAYADTLHEAGYEVVVVTGVPHYPAWRRGTWSDDGLPYRVLRAWHFVPRRPTAVQRALYEATFAASAFAALARVRGVHVVLAVVPTLASAAAASLWCKSRGIPVAAVVQDLVSAAVEQTAAGGSFVVRAARSLERVVFSNAAAVGVLHEAMIPTVMSLGGTDRVRLVPNWPLEGTAAMPTYNEARATFGFPSDEFVCLHAGNMGAKQGLEVVVEAARLAEQRALPIRFVLMGDGSQRNDLVRRAQGMRKLEIWPLQDTVRYNAALAAADALLLTQRRSVVEMSFPGKLIEYVRVGRPIIAAVAPESATGQTLARVGAAVVTSPEDPAALLEAAITLRNDDGRRRRLVGAATEFYRRELEPARLRQRFAEFVRVAGSVQSERPVIAS